MKIGDRVVKNPATWRAGDFDEWGAGIGVGVVVEPPWRHEDGVFPGDVDDEPCVDVRWPAGRCFQMVRELLLAEEPEPAKSREFL